MVRGLYKLIRLLAAVTLEQIHGIYRYCVASNVVFVHRGLLTFWTLSPEPPLYTHSDTTVITPYLVVTACLVEESCSRIQAARQKKRRLSPALASRVKDFPLPLATALEKLDILEKSRDVTFATTYLPDCFSRLEEF